MVSEMEEPPSDRWYRRYGLQRIRSKTGHLLNSSVLNSLKFNLVKYFAYSHYLCNLTRDEASPMLSDAPSSPKEFARTVHSRKRNCSLTVHRPTSNSPRSVLWGRSVTRR